MATTPPTHPLRLTCYCTHTTLTLPISSTSLPLQANFCHCNSCRHGTGAPVLLAADISPSLFPGEEEVTKYGMVKYKFTERVDVWFCGRCGTWIFWRAEGMGYLGVLVGAVDFENVGEVMKGLEDVGDGGKSGAVEKKKKWSDVINITEQMLIGDTLDGGISDWLRKINGVELESWLGLHWKKEKCPIGWGSEQKEMINESGRYENGDDILRAKCLCGGVKFFITRLTAESEKFIIKNPGPTAPPTWPLDASKTRYQAHLCTCTSCRLATCSPVAGYVTVPLCNLRLAPDKITTSNDSIPPQDTLQPLPSSLLFGTLRSTRTPTTKDATRYFCGTCGASVFWVGNDAEGRSGVPHVSVGLLQAPEGMRAEKWLKWRWEEDVSGGEEGGDEFGREMAEALGGGMRAWGGRKGRVAE